MYPTFSGNLVLGGAVSIFALLCGRVLLAFMVLEGTKGDKRYGPDPKGGEAEAVA